MESGIRVWRETRTKYLETFDALLEVRAEESQDKIDASNYYTFFENDRTILWNWMPTWNILGIPLILYAKINKKKNHGGDFSNRNHLGPPYKPDDITIEIKKVIVVFKYNLHQVL